MAGKPIDWALAASLAVGVALSTPVAAFIVTKPKSKHLKLIIGGCTLVLGALTIFKTVRVL